MRATPNRTTAEDGIALFYALLVTLVVGGIVVIVFATAISEQRQAAFEVDFEDTIHVAEAGAEIYLQVLEDVSNSQTSGVPGPDATSMDPAEWAIDTALQQDATGYVFDAVTMAEGETVGLRPNGEDAEFVYGVGFVPSRDAYVEHVTNATGEAYARVVRVQVAFAPSTFVPQTALLTGGNLSLGGNYKIEGSNGAVHTNGGISINGSSGTATSGVSYSGSCTKGCDQATGPVTPQPISAVSIREFWDSDEATTIVGAQEWYDYCSGTWHRRGLGDDDPCDGPVASLADPNLQPWTGLSYNNPAVPSDAVYYFDGDVDIDIKKPTGDITFITGGTVSVGPGAQSDPPDARYPGWYIVADGSISVSGNATGGTFQTKSPAIIWSNATIDIGGTLDTNQIAFIALDDANIGSSYSGGGSGSIRFDGDVNSVIPGDEVPIVVQWDEVLAP